LSRKETKELGGYDSPQAPTNAFVKLIFQNVISTEAKRNGEILNLMTSPWAKRSEVERSQSNQNVL